MDLIHDSLWSSRGYRALAVITVNSLTDAGASGICALRDAITVEKSYNDVAICPLFNLFARGLAFETPEMNLPPSGPPRGWRWSFSDQCANRGGQ